MTERIFDGKPDGWDERPYFPGKAELEEMRSLLITPDQAEGLLINGISYLSAKQKAALQRIAELEGPDAVGDLAEEYAKEFDEEDNWD